MAPGSEALMVVVGLAAVAAAIRTRQQGARWTLTIGAVAAAIALLAWPLLDAIGVDLPTSSYVIAPVLFVALALLFVGKLGEAVRALKR